MFVLLIINFRRPMDSQHSKNSFCASIKSSQEPHLRCLLKVKGNQKYCPLHMSQKNVVDYSPSKNLDDIEFASMLKMEQIRLFKNKVRVNPVIKKISLVHQDSSEKDNKNIEDKKNEITTLHEQKLSTLTKSHKKNEEDLDVKLLILVNTSEFSERIADLIGPIFKDINVTEDEQDPVTLDQLWKYSNGVRVGALVNKYYLFSYIDSKGKVRCLTIFTLYHMIIHNDYVHPVTKESIPEKDIQRAKELVNLYRTKLGLFKEQDDGNYSLEYRLQNRLNKLFNRFHVYNIYLEDSWLLSISDSDKLFDIIEETRKLVSNNIDTINPIFKKKRIKYNKNSPTYEVNLLKLKEYIVLEWEKLIDAVSSPQNQIPIWIIVSGLSLVVPEVKQKYPNVEIMFN